jgi:ribosomal protein L7/L12
MSGGTVYFEDLNRYFSALSERIGALEAQMVLVSEKVGLPYAPASAAVPADVVELARAGKTLDAIKRYRELTGAGLEEAREAVLRA